MRTGVLHLGAALEGSGLLVSWCQHHVVCTYQVLARPCGVVLGSAWMMLSSLRLPTPVYVYVRLHMQRVACNRAWETL